MHGILFEERVPIVWNYFCVWSESIRGDKGCKAYSKVTKTKGAQNSRYWFHEGIVWR